MSVGLGVFGFWTGCLNFLVNFVFLARFSLFEDEAHDVLAEL